MASETITRRNWLGCVPGSIALLSAGAELLKGQEYHIAGADLKLGVASYSFRKFPRERAIAMTKELGTPYINIKSAHLAMESTPEQIDAAKKEFAAAGLIVVGIGNVDFLVQIECE